MIFGTHRIKFFSNSSIEEAKYDKITQRHPWTLFGLPLPITVEREVYRFYETVPQSRTPAQAEQSAGQALEQYLEDLVSPYGEVKSTLISSSQRGDILTVTLRAECQEEIGRSVPIYTQDTPPDQEGGHTQE